MKKGEPKITKANKIVIVSGIIIVITLIIGSMFIYAPFTNKNKSLRLEILHERDVNVLIGKIRALGKHLKVYEKRIPKDVGVSWLLGEISDMASKEHVEISSITPGSPEAHDRYTKLYINMEIFSTYHQLGRFISRVESSEKFLRVESVNIKRLDLDEAFGKKEAGKFKAFDVKASIVIGTVILKE